MTTSLLPETVERELSAVLTTIMRRLHGDLPPLSWRVDDLRAVERPWPLLPRLAIVGTPAVGADVEAARRWADALALVAYPTPVRGVVEWRGDVDGMAVRVWARTAPVGESVTCPRCGRTSYHPADVAERYCSVCGSHDGLLPKGDRAAGGRR